MVEPNTGNSHRACHPPGHYARLNKGLDANLTTFVESSDEDEDLSEEALFADNDDICLLPHAEFALGSSMGTELMKHFIPQEAGCI